MDRLYEEGEQILFLNKNDKWDRPAEVQSIKGKTIFIHHNGEMKKVALCRARPLFEGSSDVDELESDQEKKDNDCDDIKETSDSIIIDDYDDDIDLRGEES